ncbi:hypothetical protein ACR79P_06495 [Sphingobacterium spiritivorum]|uniref:hypothetical protein n=1 Tax=Sphingobacterium spiritivorum TaxID=258 RepID=UPI003DA45C40
MHIVDFLVNLGAKFAPIDASSVKTLQIQLTDEYNKTLNKTKMKLDSNIVLDGEVENLHKQAEEAKQSGDTPKFSDIAYRINEIEGKRPKVSLIEKAIIFFDKPIVKFGLMIAFGFLVSYLIKRKLGSNKEEEEEDDLPQSNNVPPMYGYPPYPYPPYPNQGYKR